MEAMEGSTVNPVKIPYWIAADVPSCDSGKQTGVGRENRDDPESKPGLGGRGYVSHIRRDGMGNPSC